MFQSAKMMSMDDKDYFALELSDYGAKIKAKKFIAEKSDNLYIADLKQYRNKRSLQANAYLWVICNKIGDILRHSKEEVYLDMLKKYGQSEIVSVKSNVNVSGYFKYYETEGVGYVNDIEFNHYKVYKGSSEYDTREMAILIDGIVSEAKEMGIETLPHEELERMKIEWRSQL